jgi:hypothetical protein
MATKNFKGSGGYFICTGADAFHYEKNTAKYLVNHPKLKWVPTTVENATKIPGKIVMKVNALYGRMNYTWANGTFSVISTILNGNFHYKIPYQGKEVKGKGAIEVLVCEP